MNKSINMEQELINKNQLYILFKEIIDKKQISNYLEKLTFDNDLPAYACYCEKLKEIFYNYSMIKNAINHENIDIYIRVLLHEIRHAEQRKTNLNYILNNLIQDSLTYRNEVNYICLPHEIDADIFSYFYFYNRKQFIDEEEAHIYLKQIYNVIKKKYNQSIPAKMFYYEIDFIEKYYSILDKIKSNYLKLQYGIYLDDKVLNEIDHYLQYPLEYKKIITKNFSL